MSLVKVIITTIAGFGQGGILMIFGSVSCGVVHTMSQPTLPKIIRMP